MAADIKFCGLTRRADANQAVALGARYVGVIFAGGPRMLTPEQASDVLADVPADVKRVGVFADQTDAEVARFSAAAQLNVLQLHARWDPERIARLKQQFEGEVWPVVRADGATLPEWIVDSFQIGHGTVLDAFVPGALGGTGVALPWNALAPQLRQLRGDARLILAGGLRPENVAVAIAAVSPDAVDVSSGVESAPGIKDHERMRAFRDAVAHASMMTP